MLLETFYDDGTKTLYTGAHKGILIHYGLCTEFLVLVFSLTLTVEEILFLSKIFEMDFLLDVHVRDTLNPKITNSYDAYESGNSKTN